MRWASWVARVVGGALLVAMAVMHVHLYDVGYATVPTIGPLFLLDGLLGVLAATAVLLSPTRWLPWSAGAGALLQIGTLAGLVLSLTVGVFGFTETLDAPLLWPVVGVEGAGFLVLAAYAAPTALTLVGRRRGSLRTRAQRGALRPHS